MAVKQITGADGTVYNLPSGGGVGHSDIRAMIDAAMLERSKRENPVGKHWYSDDPTNPAEILGFGTWTRIKARFTWLAADGETAGVLGGEATHMLTVAELASHRHILRRDMAGAELGIAGPDSSSTYGNAITGNYSNVKIYANSLGASDTGGGQPHNNMPPYRAAYGWVRTA